MANNYANAKELFKKMIEEEKMNIKASDLVGSGLTPKDSLMSKLAMKDKIYHEASVLSMEVNDTISTKKVKDISKLIVKTANNITKKEEQEVSFSA
ncbi:MAG: hypothetical protein IKA36_07100 [Clostridia bacterium]|nr:hypothetical protein [Clostridia bacterium]